MQICFFLNERLGGEENQGALQMRTAPIKIRNIIVEILAL